MATLNTVFKQVFGERLKEYGFVKIKGRQPYFVRVIGDEIIHIITCKNEWCGEAGYGNFSIYGGVATVYRRAIDLTCSPRDNTNWLSSLSDIYWKSNPLTYNDRKRIMLMEFLYRKNNENSLGSQMRKALIETEKIMIPVLKQVTDLNACIEYYRIFQSPMLNLPSLNKEEENFGYNDYNEGLLYIQTDNHDDLISVYQKMFVVSAKEIKLGRAKGGRDSLESKARSLEEWRISTVTKRDQIYNTPYIYKKALEELEERKNTNRKELRSYGLDI